MNEVVEKQVEQIMGGISGFSWADQAFMLTEIVERPEDRRADCWMREYGFFKDENPAQTPFKRI
jgi:hypothetical protein